MPKRKVRHALLQYEVDGRTELAFRGDTVTISADEAERYDALGATVPADAELDRPGVLGALPESPTDEELVAYVIAATDTELRATLAVRPELGPRIQGARAYVTDSRATALRNIGVAERVVESDPAVERLQERLGESAMLDEENASTRPTPTGSGDGPTEGQGGDTPANAGDDGSGPSVTVSDPNDGNTSPTPDGASTSSESWPSNPAEAAALPNTTAEVEAQVAADADTGTGPTESWPQVGDDDAHLATARAIVAGNVEDVTGFVADNPEMAAAVLQAENELQRSRGKDPRAGVVRAVEAAAGHTQ